MRSLLWLLILAALAIGLALLGRLSDGYVLWVVPPWRVTVSFNFYLLAQLAILIVAYLLLRGLALTLGMPRVVAAYRARRARERADREATAALRQFWEGRYALALRSAEAALEYCAAMTPVALERPSANVAPTASTTSGATTGATTDAQGIATLVALKAAHALHDAPRIAAWSARAAQLDTGWRSAWLMAQMRIALDARDFQAARQAYEQLGTKERRQISALRLALRLAQGENDWAELLRLTRLLEKHGALTAVQAAPLRLRAQRGIIDQLQDDPALLMKHWRAMPTAEQADAQVVQRAVRALTAAGACNDSAQLVEDHLAEQWTPALLTDYAWCVDGDVLRRIAHGEQWLHAHPQDAELLLALGRLCARQQLWGKAQSYLEASLAVQETRTAHIELARLLEQLQQAQTPDQPEKSALAGRHYRAAALL